MTMGSRFNFWSAKKKIVILTVCAISLVVLWRVQVWAQATPDCPVALTDHQINGKTCPVVGHMGNVRLVVPDHYILGPVAYKGVDIWNPKSYQNRPKHPTFDTEIDNFAIKIRLSNFKPIETRKDWDDYDKLGKARGWAQPPENRWIFVEFFTHDVQTTKRTMRGQLNFWLKDKSDWGTFVKSSSLWGLQHYISTQQPSTQKSQYEIFYDPKTEDTFINCENRLIAVPPYELFSHCRIDFLIRDLKIRASVDEIYFKEDLSHWQKIEEGIKQVVQSFVVP